MSTVQTRLDEQVAYRHRKQSTDVMSTYFRRASDSVYWRNSNDEPIESCLCIEQISGVQSVSKFKNKLNHCPDANNGNPPLYMVYKYTVSVRLNTY